MSTSYATWVMVYSVHLMNMKKIVEDITNKPIPFDEFCKLIYQNSHRTNLRCEVLQGTPPVVLNKKSLLDDFDDFNHLLKTISDSDEEDDDTDWIY